MTSCRRLSCIAVVIVLVVGLQSAGIAKSGPQLPQRYREWLNKEVAYIITSDEKQAFLKLASDEDRDKFIQTFWEIRNPDPGAPTNAYKDEHYRRLAYASQYFGTETHSEGWRTDRGRVYITLGPPKQKALYYGYQQLRRFEIWFYSNAHPALPPFFSVIFYQQYDQGEFRLFSPYVDGPDKLVTTDSGSRAASIQVIDRQAGREVARTVLSLLPDEPVDLNTGQASLISDVLLSTIRGLADNAMNKDMLRRRREMLEGVTHRIVLGEEFVKLQTLPLRDANGNTALHYLLRLSRPEDFSVGRAGNGNYFYNVEVVAHVMGPNNKPIYTRHRDISEQFGEAEYERVKARAFAVEDTLPIIPGRYHVEFEITNKLHNSAVRTAADVVIPETPSSGVVVPGIIAFDSAEQTDPSPSAVVPFSGGGIRFLPLSSNNLEYSPGQDVNILYQIWAPPTDPRQQSGKKMLVDYAYGRLGMTGQVKTIHDEVDRGQFDVHGSMLNGKRIPLEESAQGNYRLVVTVTDPDSQQKTTTAMNFRVTSQRSDPAASWYVYPKPEPAEDEYERGMAYYAAGKADIALTLWKTALTANPAHAEAQKRIVSFYSEKGDFASIASLYPKVTITKSTDEQTLLRVAEALQKTGAVQQAVVLLESMVNSRPASGPMFLALSGYYRQLGQRQKADEMEKRGKSLMTTPSGV
jgi:GWxTD domain-containing protein